MSKPRDLSKLFTSNTNITTDVELFSTVNSASAYALSEANDYTDTAVSSLDAFPEQSGNSGKYLSTTGSAAFWAALDLNSAITTASAAAYSSASTYTDSELASIDLSATIQTASAAAVSYLVDGAPAALNTLNELAAALNDNANILDTLLTTTAASSTYLPITASAAFTRWTKTLSASATTISGVDDNSITLQYNPSYEQVFINGVLIAKNEYTATSGSAVVLAEAAVVNDVIDIYAYQNSTNVNTYSQTQIDAKYNNLTRWKKIYSASATVISGNDDNSLPLSYTSGYEQVYLNGILLTPITDYARTSASVITLPSAVVTNDVIEIINTQPFNVADVYTTSQANSTFLTQTSASTTYLTQSSASTQYVRTSNATSVPYAMSAGIATLGNVSQNSQNFASVTFPVGRFTQAPIITTNANDISSLNTIAYASSTVGFFLYGNKWDAGTATAPTAHWIAVQMTSGSAGG